MWLQIVSIALAPGLGFVGVAIGAGWKNRSDQRLALRNHRRDVYIEYLRAAESAKLRFSVHGPPVFRRNDPVEIKSHVQATKAEFGELLAMIHQVDLVGSTETSAAAGEFLMCVADGYLAMVRAMHGGFDRQAWNKVILRTARAASRFRDAAAADLGVPRSERRRRRGKATPELEKLLGQVDAMVAPVDTQVTGETDD